MRGERAAAARINPNSRGGRRGHRTVAWAANEGMGRKRKNEMVGGVRGGEGAQAKTGKGEEEQRGRLGGGWGSTPIMHLETGHSDSMQRVRNLPSTSM